ncbi:hypothetical protein [Psychroserpens algicola]|uniref:DUF2207 domain-containing protein n=1 Tax=Psychroserpens algicola TaxID=1719034 RepID=A0ABT0HCH5_9FLAO|nr:hypothetical protein [Psychroserpens algicola]MCK8482075.1 hypothetical protein [Psychroserpens algicola]
MLHFSEKEYDHLKREVSDIRSYITRLIGFIITVAGLSVSLIEAFMETHKPLKELAIIAIAIAIITFLFELVWYKFKSHNRYTGYIQLITQEVDFITKEKAISDEVKFDAKDYVKNYEDYIYDGDDVENNGTTKPIDRFKNINLTSWEFIMSRLNSSGALKKHKDSNIEKTKLEKAISKSMFVFKLPDNYKYEFITDYQQLDLEFSNAITYDLYRGKRFNGSKETSEDKPKHYKLDKRYTTVGWGYPRLISFIAFSTISILMVAFISIFTTEFISIPLSQATFKECLPPVLLGIISLVYIYWIIKLSIGLKALSSGKYSIDGYCWTFFIFRVQLLNSRGIIPIYFSRSFIRFFKNQLILQDLDDAEVQKYVETHHSKIHFCLEKCKTNTENEDCTIWNEYKALLKAHGQISDNKKRLIHEAFNEAVKVKRKIIKNPHQNNNKTNPKT